MSDPPNPRDHKLVSFHIVTSLVPVGIEKLLKIIKNIFWDEKSLKQTNYSYLYKIMTSGLVSISHLSTVYKILNVLF